MPKNLYFSILLCFVIIISSCSSKSELITTYKETYATVSNGSSSYFQAGGKFDQLKQDASVTYFINPTIYNITGEASSAASPNKSSTEMLNKIVNNLENLGFTKTNDQSTADLVVNATVFRLVVVQTIWIVDDAFNPYFNSWGVTWYPWFPYYSSYVYMSRLLLDCVDGASIRLYKDWYNNTWLPANPDKQPLIRDVPQEFRVVKVWQGLISGENSFNEERDNSYIIENIDKVFSQSASYLKAK